MKEQKKKVALMPTHNKLIGAIIAIIIMVNVYGYIAVFRGFLAQDIVKLPSALSILGLITVVVGILFAYSLYLKEVYNKEYYKNKLSKIFAFLFLITMTLEFTNQKYLIVKDLNLGFLPVTPLQIITNIIPIILIVILILDAIYLIFSKTKKNVTKQYILVSGVLFIYIVFVILAYILNLNLELHMTLLEYLFYCGLILILIDDTIGYIFMILAQVVTTIIFILPSDTIKSIMSFRELTSKLAEGNIPLQSYTYTRYYTEHLSIIGACIVIAIILISILILKNQYKQ